MDDPGWGGDANVGARSTTAVPSADRVQELEQRLDDLERRGERGGRSSSIMQRIVPEDARRHLRAAGREALLAGRSVIDACLERVREPEDTGSPRETIRIE